MTRNPGPITPELLAALARHVRSGRAPLASQRAAASAAANAQFTAEHASPPPESAPTSAATDERTQRAMTELTRARATVADIIVDANKVTETETLAVGESLCNIVSEAEGFVQELRSNFSALQSDGGEGGIVRLIDNQGIAIQTYVAAVQSDSAEHRATAEAALTQTQTIMRVGTTINEVARSSKMLALNASIEAARLGQAGRSFAVIAGQMQTLSDRVHESNQLIADLATGLMEILPRIVEMSNGLSRRSGQFSGEFQTQSKAVQAATARLETALASSMKGGDQRLAAIIGASQEALSHLQFQDPTAQRLMRIDKTLETVQRQMLDILDTHAHAELIEVPMQEELGGGIDLETAPESGDVMLF